MVDIDTFTGMVEQAVESIPSQYLAGLNGGVLVLEKRKSHPGAPDGTVILGEYVVRPWLGNHITIYYGSFMAAYSHLGPGALKDRIRRTILHEIRHHVESKAGVSDLELEDHRKIRDMWRRAGEEDPPGR